MGLDHVVIGASVEAVNAIVDSIAGGEDEDRDVVAGCCAVIRVALCRHLDAAS